MINDELNVTDRVNEALKNTINSLQDENKNLKIRIVERDKIIMQEFKRRIKQKNRIVDLENNVELLFNNLSIVKQRQIKNELSTDDNLIR